MMNSALKPVIPQPQPGGQGSPAKGNVATVTNAVGHPQGAQNSLNHGSNNLVVQNLTHHQANSPQPLPHAAPSMAPVPANLVQMAQNMSHHGNLSHIQNSAPPPPGNTAASPTKSASTSSPLSLVADKVTPSQPLALTRTPEKKEPESSGHSNGNVESPKVASNAPNAIKAQNPEVKEKQDIAKTSPSTPKPPEKPASVPDTPQKPEASNSVSTADGPVQPKVATANEPPEKSPSKPAEPKPAPTADVAPSQSDSKPVPESAKESPKDSPAQEKALTPQKAEAAPAECPKIEAAKPEEKKMEAKVDKAEEKPAEPKKEAPKLEKMESPKKVVPEKVEKVEEKSELKTPKPEAKAAPKSNLKLATVTPPVRKRRQTSLSKTNEVTPAKKPAECDSTSDSRSKRNRTKVQLYQSPTPEIVMATKLSASAGRSTPTKQNDDKLIVFYKNEYLAVRNSEGSFYVCQTMQNVYRTTRKIKIRWLSQDKAEDPSGETYKPDFYDVTDMECVLTTLSLARAPSGGKAMTLRPAEAARARSILERALQAEAGERASVHVTEEHPDGLDLSLYTDESQLESKSRKRQAAKKPADASDTPSPAKKARATPKRSPKSSKKAKSSGKSNKRSAGSTPVLAGAKTATAVTEKAKAKSTPKRGSAAARARGDTPAGAPSRGRRAAKDNKPSPIVPTPSTSTGKATRTPRKPPSKK